MWEAYTVKTLLIVGNDKFSGRAIEYLGTQNKQVMIVVDSSTNIRRVFHLLCKKRISFQLLCKMMLCSVLRKGRRPALAYDKISSNKGLQSIINENCIELVILFRAGLLINAETLAMGVPIFNIHCAKLPEYGGLGAIQKALLEGAYMQAATLHVVTKSIDEGKTLDTEPYSLDTEKSYCENEDVAYQAGIDLLKRTIQKLRTKLYCIELINKLA